MAPVKTILVTGSNGLLGQKIIYALRNQPDIKCVSTSRGENRMKIRDGYLYESLDITSPGEVRRIFDKYHPDAVIHTAALTNVDACETEKDEAWRLNVQSVETIISECRRMESHLVHLSTDFVFNGNNGPYLETDSTEPLSYYGETKRAAEKLVESSGLSWSILRTIIIYGVVDDNTRSNVVLWTINSLTAGKKIRVITDQYRSPTLAEDLADACISAARKRAQGIFHASGRELMCMIDIVRIVADYFKLDSSCILPVTSAELSQSARRPPVTGFILEKAERELGYSPHSFLEGLEIVRKQLLLVV